MSTGSPIVLVHGAWHASWSWARVTPLLAAAGSVAVAVDLAGHGLDSRVPATALARPFDEAAFATEPSPVADVTLDVAAGRLAEQLEQVAALGGPCVLVGHSMGGTVVTAAAERASEHVRSLVYVCAFMPASGVPAGAYIRSAENEGELVGALLVADPEVTGALRLDPRSVDPDYRDRLARAFYGGVPDDIVAATIRMISTDFPLAIAAGATELSAECWGALPRTYVVCTADEAIREPLQRRFVEEADAAFPGNPTHVVELDTAHSPMLALPAELAGILLAS